MAHPKIEKLYKKIPSFKCKPGCADCCGIIPWARSEWDSLPEKKEAISTDCPYIGKDDNCSIYEQRPYMCRLFGNCKDPMLRCPHGCGPEKPLSWQKAQKLTNRYRSLIDK